ncbi:hypothetical protein GBAR_LOCUS4499 [Geodia barretti]|uniref:Uncharacterized protein n=1 Tax=Geodia barretti TaxID=519541 RepID=A0AA35R7G3_GEOBA|nr:hypothetical protein GBAR_LOCUS4499 [Geodia barretti]
MRMRMRTARRSEVSTLMTGRMILRRALSTLQPTRRVWMGVTTERVAAWAPSGAVWLGVAGVALVWATAWKVVLGRIPYIKDTYPPSASSDD